VEGKGRKWGDPMFPGQSSIHPSITRTPFFCFFTLFVFQKPYYLYGALAAGMGAGRFQETSTWKRDGERERELDNRLVYVCVNTCE
jgi:hypothetical protein